MNVEIGSTLINGFAMNRALSVIYKDLKDSIEVNSVASKYIFADISELKPEFNVLKNYPIAAFKTFGTIAEVNIKNVAIVPATYYDITCAGIVTLVDVSTMMLQGLGLVRTVTALDVEVLWLSYLSEAKEVVSNDAGNLISIGTDGKIYLSKDVLEATENKINVIDDDIQVVKVLGTYLDYNASEIKKLENVHDGCYVVILKDQLHDNKPWLYILSNMTSVSPDITPVKEYSEIKQYPSAVAVKSYVDAKIIKTTKNFDNDTIVRNPSELWTVALDRHTINKNKNGLYAVDLVVLKTELLNVPSTQDHVAVFNDNGYIKDDGWGITTDMDVIDDGAKKLVSKKFLNAQYITDSETSDLIRVASIKQ